MKKLIAALILSLSVCGGTPASAYELETEDYFTNGSMGCMMMRECTKDVKEVKSIKDIEDYQRKDHSLIANEFNDVLKAVNDVGINVYIAPMEYFLIGTRGVYYTDGNNIFLNADMVERSTSLISTFRHEGWHAVQDCMAGDIKNSFIAIVYPQDKVPKYLQALAENTYTQLPQQIKFHLLYGRRKHIGWGILRVQQLKHLKHVRQVICGKNIPLLR